MIKIRTYSSRIEAQLASEFLQSQEIQTELRGSKEYASHITGNDFGSYELFVEEQFVEKARGILNGLEKPSLDAPTESDPSVYFKRAVICAVIAAIVLPIVFNFASLRYMALFRNTEKNKSRRNLLSIFLFAAQLPGLITLYFILMSLNDKWKPFSN
jgi:hypothetical protein